MKNKKLLVVSFSGGRTSAFMCKFIQEYPKYKSYDKLFIYANTGLEHPGTIEFIKNCDKAFNLNLVKIEAVVDQTPGVNVTYKVCDYDELTMDGSIFRQVVKKYGLPNFKASICTRSVKVIPMEKYVEDLNYRYVTTAVGIRNDEKHRISQYARDRGIIYPLVDDIKIDEAFIKTYWSRQPFDLEIPPSFGNCDLCFKKSIKHRLNVLRQKPAVADFWLKLENDFKNDQVPMLDLRQQVTVQDLVEMAKDFEPFGEKPFRSKHWNRKTANMNLDLSFDCLCKST